MKRMAVISAGFVPVPAVDGGAGEVLTTQIIEGNEKTGDYFMDIYTIESSKLNNIQYKNAEIIQIHISKPLLFFCKARNAFLKLLKKRYRFIPYNRALLKVFRDNYDMILIENNMQVYEDIYKHAKNGTDNMIYHMHNDIDGTTKPEYLCEFIGKTAKVILPVCEYIKRRFCEVAPNDKTKVFYNCIDMNIFDAEKITDRKQTREKYGIQDKEFVFLFSGSVYPGKGVLELLKAFKRVRQQNHNVKLMIVGSRWYNLIDRDEYYTKLIEEAKEVERDVVFTGFVKPDSMPEIYSAGDALVISSICEEAFPLVALEGMAMRMPIISTNSGGVVESLIEGTAIVVNKKYDVVKELEKAMTKILLNKNLRENLAQNAYMEVCSNPRYNKDKYFENLKKLLDEADRNME